MKKFYTLESCSSPSQSVALTIGNFDGVHLGHQAVLQHLKSIAEQSFVLTFSNHPCEVLRNTPIPRLTTLDHRLHLLETFGMDATLLIPFTMSFAQQSAREFLFSLKQHIPFSHIILGHDAVIGHDRNDNLSSLSQELDFKVEYIPPVYSHGQILSSSVIRSHIQSGELKKASLFLGRPYSIYATVESGEKKGRLIGFHTANLPVEDLALPPLGVYAVDVKLDDQIYSGVANLGHAPTLHDNRPPYLEVHLIENHQNLYGKQIEVFFHKFIRPEKKFMTITDLKNQIQEDIKHAIGDKYVYKE